MKFEANSPSIPSLHSILLDHILWVNIVASPSRRTSMGVLKLYPKKYKGSPINFRAFRLHLDYPRVRITVIWKSI
jgi:hypothetical protein